jgi:hypothetical protein
MASIERLNRAVLLAMLGLTLLTQRGAALFVMSSGFAALYGLTASSRPAHVRESLLGRGAWLVPLIVLLSVYESLGRLIAGTGMPLRDSAVLVVEYAVTRAALPPLADWHFTAVVVDAFSLAYLSYFALPVALLWSVWRRRGVHAASQVMLTLFVAFYVHYAIYVVMPVVGPIRAIDVTGAVRDRLVAEGGTVTHVMRAMVGAVEGTRQDAFPSAHTSVSLLVAALARRYRLRGRTGFYAITASIIASTVVLGYHYVTDLIAAVPVAVFVWRGMTHRVDDASEFLGGQAGTPPCVITYGIAQRTREIAIRVALGATRQGVIAFVLKAGLAPVVASIAIGCVIALVAGGSIAPLLFRVSARDPFVFLAVIVALLVVALAATCLPARAAMRLDPNSVLRTE